MQTDILNRKSPLRGTLLRAGVLLLLLLALLALLAGCGGKTGEPAVTETPAPGGKTVDNPVNGAAAEDLGVTLDKLAEEEGVLTAVSDGYIYTDEDGAVTLSIADPEDAEAALSAASAGEGDPSIVTGAVGDTSYIAVSAGGNVTVYVTVGDQTVKAETPKKSGKADGKAIKKAATVASSVVTAARVEEGYTKGRDDYDHNAAAYYMPHPDCLVFYPAQLSKKTEFEDQSVIFADRRSSVTCSVRLERNPYRDMDELDSLIRNSPNNTVLAWGDDWLTAEHVRDGIVTFSYIGFGKKFMVTAELCYPRKYSFVFDDLRELISVRFLEGGKWVNGNRPAKTGENGAPLYGVTQYYYPAQELYMVLPETFDEQAETGDRIVFQDSVRNKGVSVQIFEVPASAADDPFAAFTVVAADGDVFLGDNYVRWHNRYGLFIGAVSGRTAALLEYEDAEAFTFYEGIYGELMIRLLEPYYEAQMTEDPDAGLENQMTEDPDAGLENQMTEDPDAGLESQMTEDPDAGLEAQMTRPVKKPEPRTENKIDKVVEKKAAQKAKEEYPPAPPQGSDPLEYYSDADYRAVNADLTQYRDCYLSEKLLLMGVIRKVLQYNGYWEADIFDDPEDLMDAVDEEIDAAFDLFLDMPTSDYYGAVPQDLFLYVCEALAIEPVPEYRVRPRSDPPEPQWLEDLRNNENYDAQDLNWDEIRRILDEGLEMPDFTRAELDPGLFTDGRTVYGGPDEPDEPDEPDWPDEPDEPDWPDEPDEPDWPDEPDEPDWPDEPDEPDDWVRPDGPRSMDDFDFEALSWDEYGILYDEETVRADAEQVEDYFWYYMDGADWEGMNGVDDYLFYHEPDFRNVGWMPERMYGFYETADPDVWDESDYEIEWYMGISSDGIWAVFDPDDFALVDHGIMFPNTDGAGDLWYSVDAGGEFVTFWEFDYGLLICSKYGSMDYIGSSLD